MTAWYAVAFASIFATNLLPAFGPPTWALLVFFSFNGNLRIAPLVIGGALCSAAGRYLLALASRHFRERFSARRRENLERTHDLLLEHRRSSLGGLGLFLLSPLPSAQLFVGAGFLRLPLVPLTGAFFAGRLVSYTLYLGGATLAYQALGDTLTDSFTSPTGIALQIALVFAIVALVEVDWAGLLERRRDKRGDAP